MREQKRYTADAMRSKASAIIDQLGGNSVTAAMLRYAADVVERANERRGAFAVNYGRIDYEWDSAIVDVIDYILRGDAGKEEK